MPWHRPSMGVALFGLWAPDHHPPPPAATQANNPSVSCLTFNHLIFLFPGPVQACLSHGASFSYSGSFACCHQCDTRRITRLSSHLRTGRIYQISSLATNKMWSDPKKQPVSSPADSKPARSHTRLSQGHWANGFTAGCSRISHQGLKFCILNHDDLDGYDLA